MRQCMLGHPPGRYTSQAGTPPTTVTAADGTHPTGMHSCVILPSQSTLSKKYSKNLSAQSTQFKKLVEFCLPNLRNMV